MTAAVAAGYAASAVADQLCAAAASGSRDTVIKVLSDYLAAVAGAGPACISRATGRGCEVLAGRPVRGDAAAAGQTPDPGAPAQVRAAGLTVVLSGALTTAGARRDIEQALQWAAAALRLLDVAAGALREAGALRAAAAQILRAADTGQALASISEHTRDLLEADICGIFLRDGEELVMRGCVGHHAAQTARLRMRPGQGLAGLVFATGTSGRVDDYLSDRQISRDFMVLAATEQTLSALAVPMRSRGDLVGVLEVWRRRESVFTDDDARRMEALADLATIAIDNARLHSAHEQTTAELRSAHQVLAGQLGALRRAASLHRALLAAVLAGAGHAGIAAALQAETGGQVVIIGEGARLLAACPPAGDLAALAEVVRQYGRRPGEYLLPGDPPRPVWLAPIVLDGEVRGQVCVLAAGTGRDGPGPAADRGDATHGSGPDLADTAGQAALAACLVESQQQAESRARARAAQEVLWDLLEGPAERRAAAASRAAALGVRLPPSIRLVHGWIDDAGGAGAASAAAGAASGAADSGVAGADRTRRQVLRCVREHAPPGALELAAQRGNSIVALTGMAGAAEIRALLAALSAAAARRWPGLGLHWAVSGPGHDAAQLPRALREAQAAMDAVRRLGAAEPCCYEDLGVARLLVGGQDGADLQDFVTAVIAPLTRYDAGHDGALLATLRAFFQAECSQRAAADRLFVHPKTLRYRLEQIRSLTGLDLARHSDRMQADLALQLFEVTSPPP